MKPNQRKSQHHMRTVTLPWAFFQGQAWSTAPTLTFPESQGNKLKA
jgi:hypothetical protein